MQNLSQNEPEKIVKMRHIENYKNMSREHLLIVLLKSKQSHVELLRSKDSNTKETKKLFNELRNNLSKKEIKTIRSKCRFREWIDKYLKN